jgi:hypothetical protein
VLVLAKKSYPQATGVLPYLADGDGACPELSVLTNLAVAINQPKLLLAHLLAHLPTNVLELTHLKHH